MGKFPKQALSGPKKLPATNLGLSFSLFILIVSSIAISFEEKHVVKRNDKNARKHPEINLLVKVKTISQDNIYLKVLQG